MKERLIAPRRSLGMGSGWADELVFGVWWAWDTVVV